MKDTLHHCRLTEPLMANGRTRDYMDDVCLSFSIV